MSVKTYYLPPTALMPNSPRPLLHYPGYFASPNKKTKARNIRDVFHNNGWEVQWIYRYGPSQRSHYHSGVHECMAVLSGTATIRFGVADTSEDLQQSISQKEDGGIELEAKAGDVFVLPAGMAHKTFHAKPDAAFQLMTPGDGHHIGGDDIGAALDETEARLSGFTMIGAYPIEGGYWDSLKGGEGNYEKVWAVPKPENDPVLGKGAEGLVGLWE